MNKVVVICGPTASGKTHFAHFLAKERKGEIVNADSMQLYEQLPIITSSPTAELTSEIPYHLYNFLNVESDYCVAEYAVIAAKKIREISTRSSLPIVVGGSGMYIGALINGFSVIPNIDPVIREKVRGLQQNISSEDFFNLLKDSDPHFSSILHVQDSQRIARAYEVYLQTGKSISFYQKNNSKLLDEFIFEVIVLLPNRSFLYSMCDERLDQMFKNGAIEEVEKVITKNQNIKTSAMKCLGVQEIISYLKGDISKNEALEKAQTKTRQYAKRQITWFKNQIKEKKILEFSNHEEYKRILKMVSPPGFEPGTT